MRFILLTIAVLFAAPTLAGPVCSSPYVPGRIVLTESEWSLTLCDPDKPERACVEMGLVISDGTNTVYRADQEVVDSHGNVWRTTIEAIVSKLPDGTTKLNGTRYMDGEVLGHAPELSCEA